MTTGADVIRALAHRPHDHDSFLELLARHHSSLWEVIGGGPQGPGGVGRVALNPQPIPPGEAGRVVLLAMARGIIIVGGRSKTAQSAFMEDIEDWCGTKWPRRWPWPGPGPFPEPDPRPDARTDVHVQAMLGAALAAAEVAASYPAGELQDVFNKASEQLTEAAFA
ncbi:hypothetical protein JNB_12498 [Janibacter sp. HTCC2649]|uniref:hypothetical protein n=1 Tax=Janibacter sp. HTCC2649 TaxID=313589 RepID=UPI0000671AE9|nr:hypothetical protein [Janibacter sp. HTCC2649]EAP97782.1 hypothetical protein JNB_12498 [Janibacter sp. HTCC2649]